MRLLLSSVFGLAVLVSGGLASTDLVAAAPFDLPPGPPSGVPPGLPNGAVPIPGTLLLFGAGFAGLVGWQWILDRRRRDNTG